jgi:hypothetical protein
MNGPAACVTDLQRGESALSDCNRGTQTRQLSSSGGGRGTALPKRAPLMAQGEVSQRFRPPLPSSSYQCARCVVATQIRDARNVFDQKPDWSFWAR